MHLHQGTSVRYQDSALRSVKDGYTFLRRVSVHSGEPWSFTFEVSELLPNSQDPVHSFNHLPALRTSHLLSHLSCCDRQILHHVVRKTDVRPDPAPQLLCECPTGKPNPRLDRLTSKADGLYHALVLQGCGPRCCWWYRPASVTVDEAQPPCLTTRALRYPHGPRYEVSLAKHKSKE